MSSLSTTGVPVILIFRTKEVASLLSNAIRLLSLHKAALARAAQEAMESKSQTECLSSEVVAK